MGRHVACITREDYLMGSELEALFSWMWVHRHNSVWAERISMVRAALGFGPRVSELTQIHTDDCYPDGLIVIRNGKAKPVKGEKGSAPHVRQVRVSPEYLSHYQVRLASLEQGLFFPRNGDSSDTKPYHRRTFWLWWSQVIEAANIRHIKFHAARHTYASWELATKRLQPHEVQAQLGHLDVKMTLQMYSHAITERLYDRSDPAWWSIAIRGPERRQLLEAI